MELSLKPYSPIRFITNDINQNYTLKTNSVVCKHAAQKKLHKISENRLSTSNAQNQYKNFTLNI